VGEHKPGNAWTEAKPAMASARDRLIWSRAALPSGADIARGIKFVSLLARFFPY